MVRSAFTAPHVSVWLDCDVTATMQLVERLKTRREFADLRVSPLLIVAKAVCLALAAYAGTQLLLGRGGSADRAQELDQSRDRRRDSARPAGSQHQGRRVARPARAGRGHSSEVVATAREGKTQPADMAGGTFTITNIGVFGVDAGTPILNPGESGISVRRPDRPPAWVVGDGADERIEPRWVTTLSVSFDHRLADGAQGSTFLADVAAILSDPGLALLF